MASRRLTSFGPGELNRIPVNARREGRIFFRVNIRPDGMGGCRALLSRRIGLRRRSAREVEIEATLVRLYKGQPIEEIGTSPISGTATAGKQDKIAGAETKITVSTPAATSEIRLLPKRMIDRLIGRQTGLLAEKATLLRSFDSPHFKNLDSLGSRKLNRHTTDPILFCKSAKVFVADHGVDRKPTCGMSGSWMLATEASDLLRNTAITPSPESRQTGKPIPRSR